MTAAVDLTRPDRDSLSRRKLSPPRMKMSDVVRVGGVGLRTRPLRAFLSALGIAIGIAAMISVVGISSSSQADLNRTLEALGTNLLTVSPGSTLFGDDAELPEEAGAMIERITPVTEVSQTALLSDAKVYRTDKIPTAQSGSIGVRAAELDLLDTVGAELAAGSWLNAGTSQYPAVVLGSGAARRLGLAPDAAGTQIYLGGKYFTVVGVLQPVALASELDSSAIVGWTAATNYLNFDGHPTTIYTRSKDEDVEAVRGVLGATANPESPNEVEVSRPSDALAARQASDETFTGLLLGLGAVALLVGGVGVANTMVISVLERRSEIGLRRSLGATRGQIRTQFLAESLLLSALGGTAGVVIGATVTGVYATTQDWPTSIPTWALVGGVAATLFIGAIAGLYPAIRASHLSPTEALTAP